MGQFHSETAPDSSKVWSFVERSMNSMSAVSGRMPASCCSHIERLGGTINPDIILGEELQMKEGRNCK
jgi:hypothetical protein